MTAQFKLSEKFIDKYKRVRPPFGYNGLGELVYLRSYSRIKENGANEEWYETVERVVNGTYTMQKTWIETNGLEWNSWKAQRSAQEMYHRMFHMKFLPPGRGLWAMGSPIIEDKGLYAALNNCAMVSTEHLKDDLSKPFTFLMDASMLGVGVGFDTKGTNAIVVKGPDEKRKKELYIIPDSREGWVESVRMLIDSYFLHTPGVEFDYTKIRAEGEPIKGFGGTSSGHKPLEKLHKQICKTLNDEIGNPISMQSIVDIMNMIGQCVISGNVRRTAEIVFGDPDSEEYLDLKDYKKNPGRKEYGWTSNNSIFANLGMDYSPVAERTKINGEPGYVWLENMRKYGRLKDPPNFKDRRVVGANPCSEQSLESYELCCLVETFPYNHTNIEDYKKTLKYAYLYAKTVTLGKTHWPETNRVMLRNRRIGCSVSGVAQVIARHGLHGLKTWLEEGYETIQKFDEDYSEWLAVPRSIKTTSVKPSGTVSLLAGATPGMHFPESRFYIRRIRISKLSNLVGPLKKAGYKVEADVNDKDNTIVVEIPVDVGENVRLLPNTNIWEQMHLASFLQKYWADNQVSCTVTFDPKKEGDEIKNALDYFQYHLKGISFLPRKAAGAYPQMPYEKIDQRTFKKLVKGIKRVSFKGIKNEQAEVEKFCDGEGCLIKK